MTGWNDMPCREVEQAIPWFLDDELDAEQAVAVDEHITTCTSCRAVLEAEGQLRLALRRVARSVQAPPSLRRRVRETFDRELPSRRSPIARWLPVAAAAAALIAFVWQSNGDLEVEQVALRRHGSGDLAMDVRATDPRDVQRYFAGKLPFAVRLPSMQAPQLREVGGRLDQVNNRDAAYVRYEMPRGRVSMFVFEGGDNEAREGRVLYRVGNRLVSLKQVHGFTTMRWSSQGLHYTVVSDLPERELFPLLGGKPVPVRDRPGRLR